MTDERLILVSNDDGVEAPGIRALADALRGLGRVVVVAPEREQSANSHSITLHRPLRHRAIGDDMHAIDGTPVDCVYVALYHDAILPRLPDLVVSGINHGPNLGNDVHYSGTVAAAREAAMRAIPAMAFSLAGGGSMEAPAALAAELVTRFLAAELPPGPKPLLNVNFPSGGIRGVRATRLGRREYDDEILIRRDPRGREYFWIGGPQARHRPQEGADTEAIDGGFASVTPLRVAATSPEHLGIAAWVAGPEDGTSE